MTDFTAVAREKLARIVGPSEGEAAFRAALREVGKAALATSDDLYAFGQALKGRGGVVGAVGGLLCLQAAIAGAKQAAAP
ncbi:MAG TPA: hypothetical protein VFS43_13580 [Polyangiaceae bacterium]|nr:hypothetical protein [Polyangiaceae bacterium]